MRQVKGNVFLEQRSGLVFHLNIVHTLNDMYRTPLIHICILIAFLVNMLGPMPLAQAEPAAGRRGFPFARARGDGSFKP